MRKNIQPLLGKPGYQKIQECCKRAAQDGFDWIWIDSCCIDKRSSAELTEAINSMFKWYAKAALCYAYLEDISHLQSPVESELLAKCRWFTRGWTLQELLAPDKVEFYAKDWTLLGRRSDNDPSFVSMLSSVTGIDQICLLRKDAMKKVSIATRMSWAATRETTRPEDRAYSLMGIFGVHMPIIYGEGLESAYERLQLEIMKNSPDQSIFAWNGVNPHATSLHGLLSPTPSYFQDSQFSVDALQIRLRPYSVTNIGIQITLRLNPVTTDKKDISLWAATLRCWTRRHGESRIQILLQERVVKIRSGIRIFQRVLTDKLWIQNASSRGSSELVELFVPNADQLNHLQQAGAIFPAVRVSMSNLSFDGNTASSPLSM